jgi:hypothetical protein
VEISARTLSNQIINNSLTFTPARMFKIYTIFALMKKRRNIFLKFILLIILLFFPGSNAHSNSVSQRYYIEVSLDTDNIQSRLTPDNDSSDEDQIDQYSNLDLSEQPECQKYGLSTMPFLNNLFFSVWQPPKVF